jgi:hypothetical protein
VKRVALGHLTDASECLAPRRLQLRTHIAG